MTANGGRGGSAYEAGAGSGGTAAPTSWRSIGDLGGFSLGRAGFGWPDQRDRGDAGLGWAEVLGAFECPVGHLAFDDAGVGAQPPWGQQSFVDLTQSSGECSGESGGVSMSFVKDVVPGMGLFRAVMRRG